MEYLIVILPVSIIAYMMYYKLIKRKNKAFEALSGIDVHLTKRSDLIPNILKIASKHMEHEKDLFESITELREKTKSGYDINDPKQLKEHLNNHKALGDQMSQFVMRSEAYPDLKSNEPMNQAMKTYSEIEEQISAARRFYNSAVTDLNNSVEIFPGNIIANFANVKIMDLYEGSENSRRSIDATDFLK